MPNARITLRSVPIVAMLVISAPCEDTVQTHKTPIVRVVVSPPGKTRSEVESIGLFDASRPVRRKGYATVAFPAVITSGEVFREGLPYLRFAATGDNVKGKERVKGSGVFTVDSAGGRW